MATAQSYQANLPDVSVTKPSDVNGVYGTGDWLTNFGVHKYAQDYQNALTENNRQYEQGMLREQRAYEEYVRNLEYQREDSKMQRLIADYKAAGLNPWLALQGGISGSSAQSQPAGSQSSVSGGSSAKSKDKGEAKGSIAALLMAAAKIVATFMG